MKKILDLKPKTYKKNLIHGEGRTWAETNCYSDVLIEQLHALGHGPIAALPFTLRADFEGDQWTFFKFPHADIIDLYGIDIQELAVWRPLTKHIEELLSVGRPALLELDSFFLPDTAGTAYQLTHLKSTVSINEIDMDELKLGYFHNQGYHELYGQDFIDIFQLNGLVHERMMPPYFEYLKREREIFLSSIDLVDCSLVLLKKNMSLIPKKNPFITFKEQFSRDLDWLMTEEIEVFHGYSFVTFRQLGACFELSETYFRWLSHLEGSNLLKIITAFQDISTIAKKGQFQLARAIVKRKPLDLTPLDVMAQKWDEGMSEINERFF